MKDITQFILNKDFLPVSDWNESGYFNGYDSDDLYNKNLKIQPNDWYYRDNKVNYTLNSCRYRTDEFASIDWNNSVVIFGCSNVFGTAIDDKHTISYQLSNLIKKPVINMGVASSSIQFSVFNSTILASRGAIPIAVVQLWTGYDRCMVFTDDNVKHYGSWNIKPNNYMDLWNLQMNPNASALIYREISKQLWHDKTKYFEATLFGSTSDIFTGCHRFSMLDRGRDLLHPGYLTALSIAEHLAEHLKL